MSRNTPLSCIKTCCFEHVNPYDTERMCMDMGLNHEHQVHLLKDILTDHQLDCCGTVAEYEQLERVIKSLMANTDLNSNIKHVLEDVYQYSQSGRTANSIDSHIREHQSHLSQWVEEMDSYS